MERTFRRELVAETSAHRDAFASLRASAREHGLTALCFHTATEAVHLRAATTVGLECTLRHGKLTTPQESVCCRKQTLSITERRRNWLSLFVRTKEAEAVRNIVGPMCPACSGSRKCTECFGLGKNTHLHSDEEQCPKCKGCGICQECNWSGRAPNIIDWLVKKLVHR